MPTTTERFRDLIGHDEQLRAMVPSAVVWAAAAAETGPFERRLDLILAGYADRPAIGERAYSVELDPATHATARRYRRGWELVTFGEIRDRARAIATAWREVEGMQVARDELVAILGFAGADFAILDLACAYAQAVTVPLQSTTTSDDLDAIFTRTEPTAVAASIGDLIVAAEHAARQPSVRSLIAFDYEPTADDERKQFDAARDLLEAAGSPARLVTLDDVLTAGQARPFTFLDPHPAGGDRLAVILHSSGATGMPKGAMFHESGLASHWDASADIAPQVTVQFAPLTHGMGHVPATSADARRLPDLRHPTAGHVDAVRGYPARPAYVARLLSARP